MTIRRLNDVEDFEALEREFNDRMILGLFRPETFPCVICYTLMEGFGGKLCAESGYVYPEDFVGQGLWDHRR